MTVFFLDGTKVTFRYPRQSGSDPATISATVARAHRGLYRGSRDFGAGVAGAENQACFGTTFGAEGSPS